MNTNNVNAHERDQDLLSSDIVDGDGNTGNSHDILAHQHTCRADQEEIPTPDLVDKVYPGNGHTDIHDIGGDGLQEGVADVRVLEEGGAVVEDEVDTSELLPRLEEDASHCAQEDAVPTVTEAV